MTKEQIKMLRDKTGKSQEDFAQLIGVSFVTINRWERGLSEPNQMAQRQLERTRKRYGLVLETGGSL